MKWYLNKQFVISVWSYFILSRFLFEPIRIIPNYDDLISFSALFAIPVWFFRRMTTDIRGWWCFSRWLVCIPYMIFCWLLNLACDVPHLYRKSLLMKVNKCNSNFHNGRGWQASGMRWGGMLMVKGWAHIAEEWDSDRRGWGSESKGIGCGFISSVLLESVFPQLNLI